MNLSPQLAKTVDEYIERIDGWRADVVSQLRVLVKDTVPNATESMVWGQIVFDLNGPMCFIKAFRNQVNLGFWRGDQLTDPYKVLEKSVDQIRFAKVIAGSAVKPKEFGVLIKNAAKLNRDYGDPTSRLE